MRVLDANLQTPFDPGAQAHFDRMADFASMTAREIFAINDFVIGCKADGSWSKIDIFCFYHPTVEGDNLLNIKGTGSNPDSVKVGSPTWSSSGFTMVTGGANYIDMGVTETTAALYGQYDGHYLCWNGASGEYNMSIGATALLNYTGTQHEMDCQGVVGVIVGSLFEVHGAAIDAIDSRSYVSYGTPGDTVTDATNQAYSLTTDNFHVGKDSGGDGNGGKIYAWGIGGGMTVSEFEAYQDRITTLMIEMGPGTA